MTETKGHDCIEGPRCALIARARADERERIIAEVRRYRMKPQADLAGAEALRDDIADWLTPVEPIGAWTMAKESLFEGIARGAS